jgi:hypothetical protein
VLAALGRASSHHELWLELHPSSGNAGIITANLKGKARAREKIVLEYNGDLRWEPPHKTTYAVTLPFHAFLVLHFFVFGVHLLCISIPPLGN